MTVSIPELLVVALVGVDPFVGRRVEASESTLLVDEPQGYVRVGVRDPEPS